MHLRLITLTNLWIIILTKLYSDLLQHVCIHSRILKSLENILNAGDFDNVW
jgi:hypothetical protein